MSADFIPVEALPLLVMFGYLLCGGPLVLAAFLHQERQYRQEMDDE